MTLTKAKIIPEKIHLVSMNIFQANLETAEDFLNQPQPIDSFEIGTVYEMAHNFKDSGTRIRLYFQMNALNGKGELQGVKVEYGIEFHFVVENFQEFIPNSKEDNLIDVALPATLLGMAYSTSRGIIFERTRGTFFQGVLLPVIDPFKMLVENERGT